jgi:ribose transport system ATP-binding protein
MSKELFRMENITKTFPGVKALDNVSFSVNVGEVHGLVGENGAGKSTLMKVMSGVHRADEGKIFIDNEEVIIDNVKKAQELGVAIIFQELMLFPHLTVADNIFAGRPPVKSGIIQDRSMVQEAQSILNDLGIDISAKMMVRELSVAQQQMVEIAKAISTNSRILVLDEPTAALSEKEIEQLFVIIERLKKRGVGMVYISHRMDELEKICERITVIRDGQYIGTKRIEDLTMDELVNMIVGRPLEEKFPNHTRTIGEVRLEVKNLVGTKGVKVDHLEVRAGEILGFAGLMGSGRSEIVRAIFGADPVISKEVYLDGRERKIRNVGDAVREGFGYATEDRKFDGLALGLDVNFNTNMAHLPKLVKHGFLDDKEGRRNTNSFIEKLKTKTPSIRQRVNNLSGGNQQKIVLAKWLCNDVDVLIVDEPTRGIDVGAKYEVYELLNELSDQGVAIIMISSELPELLGMSDRVLVVHEGKINGEFNSKETTQEELLFYAAGYNLLNKNKEATQAVA